MKVIDFKSKRFEKLQREAKINDIYWQMKIEEMSRQVERLFSGYSCSSIQSMKDENHIKGN